MDARGAIHKLPDECVEAAEFTLHGAKRLSIPDGRQDLEAVPDDIRVQQKRSSFLFIEPRQLAGIEIGERLSVPCALVTAE